MSERAGRDISCVAGQRGSLWAVLVLFLIAGCSSTADDLPPADVFVTVYVDRDLSTTWSDGDIPLTGVSVSLDGESAAITDEAGRAFFETVSQGRHVIALNDEDIEQLLAHSLYCDSASQTIELSEDAQIGFCFEARGFLDVDVGEQH